ncbi:MAG: glycosyltransferase family 4 protein [Candidatus Flexifilum sp.]
MRILVLTDEIYPDGVSGIGKSVFNECAALVRRGHAVTVCVRSINPDLPLTAQIDGIEIRRFHGPRRSDPLYHLYPLTIFRKLPGLIGRLAGDFDIVYTFNPLYIFAARQSAKTRHLPIVHAFYSSIAEEIRINARRGKYGWRGRIGGGVAATLERIERRAFRQVDRFLARSQYTRDVLVGLYPFATIADVLPTGVNIQQYRQIDQAEARARLGLPPSVPILITVRRLEGRMGLHNLIRAMQTVHQQHPDARLLIAGKGHLRQELEELIQDLHLTHTVELLGFVSEADLPVYLAASDLFVLPTEMLEGFGLATIEALAVGLPVIGTPVGATPEILVELDRRLITRDTTPEALADTIRDWLARSDDLRGMRSRCRSLVETRYDVDTIAQRLTTDFAGLLSDRAD